MPARLLLILLLLLPLALTPRAQSGTQIAPSGEARTSCCVLCTCGDQCPCTIDAPAERPAPQPYAPTRGPDLTAVASKASSTITRREPSRPVLAAPIRDERAGLCNLPVLARLCVWRT